MRDRIINFLNFRPYATVFIACILAAICILSHPSFQAFKKWRANGLLEQSNELLEEEAYRQSFQKAHAAVLLDGKNLEASRHLATLALRFHHPEAHRFWENVVLHRDAEPQDWAYAIDSSLVQENYSAAFEYLDNWKTAGVETPSAFEVRRGRAFALSGHYQQAIEHVSQALQSSPNELPLRSLYLNLLSTIATEPEKIATANTILSARPPSSLELEWLARQSSLPPEQRFQAIELLLSDPQLSLDRELSYLNLAATLGWGKVAARAQDLAARIDQADTSQLGSYTTLLCSIGAYDQVLALVSSDEAKQDRILLRNLLISQIQQGETQEALELTSTQRNERLTSVAEETLIRALAFQEEGNDTQYSTNLDHAINSAETDDLAFLEQQFRRLGETQSLLKLYKKVSASPQFGPRARYLWLELAAAERIEKEIQEAISGGKDWVRQLRTPIEKANAIYYRLVYDIETDATRQDAQELLATFNNEPTFRYLLGLAYLKAENRPLAKTFVPREPVPDDPRKSIIAAAIHGESLPPHDYPLLPGEAALLNL